MFGATYASVYDTLYAEKDYEAECDQLVAVFKQHGSVKKVLDLGAGTGNHAIPLATRGYDVTGVDLSAGMVAQARVKAAERGLPIEFHQGDIRTASVPGTFDAALMMFAVLGYQTTNADVAASLRTARRHLKPGGLLVFDVWHAPAVLRSPPGDRVRVQPASGGRVIRLTSPELDAVDHLCRVRFRTLAISGSAIERETDEVHVMRFFSVPELRAHLEAAGFGEPRFSAFPAGPLTPDTWNLMCVATVPS